MRYHTVQHVLSAVLLDEFSARTVGNQLYHDRARLDCDHQAFTDTDLAEIEYHVNHVIDGSHPVSWYVVNRDEIAGNLDPERTRIDLLPESITKIRIVEIEDIDRTACAGTHVSNTNNIGRFSIEKRETGGADRERIHFLLD